jgi:membrane-bound ClpP family serine protease
MMEVFMTATIRQKFSSQATPEVLAALRKVADSEGRQFQAVLDEAMREYIERKKNGRPRRHVIDAFAHSLDEFDKLYRELAK